MWKSPAVWCCQTSPTAVPVRSSSSTSARFPASVTPLARITFELERLPVKRPGQATSAERGALHVFAASADGGETLAGSIHLKPGGAKVRYPVDVTGVVNAVLARPAGERKLRLATRLVGKPVAGVIYALPAAAPALEIASSENWTDDWEKRVATSPAMASL